MRDRLGGRDTPIGVHGEASGVYVVFGHRLVDEPAGQAAAVPITAASPGFSERLEISGTKGTIIVEKDRVILREIEGEKKRPAGGGGADQAVGASDPQAISNRGHVLQIQDFVRAIQEGRAPLISGAEGRKPLEIILAAYESARTGKRVRLPLKRR